MRLEKGQAGGGLALVVFLAGVPGGEDALVACRPQIDCGDEISVVDLKA